MPAKISKEKYKKVLKIAKKAHDIFKCRGVTRSDFKYFKGNFYMLEIKYSARNDKSFSGTGNSKL